MPSPLALLPLPRHRYWTQNGADPLAGGILQFFDVGTSTPKQVFADPQGTVSLGVEVELDEFGYAPAIFISPSAYRVVLVDHAGVEQWDVDGVQGSGGAGGGGFTGRDDHVVRVDGTANMHDSEVVIDDAGNTSGIRDLTVTGRLIIPAASGTIALVAGLNNDVALPDATLINVSVSGGVAELTGLTGGVEGRVVWLRHIGGGFDFHTLGEHAGSAAANRFTEASLNIAVGQTLALHYNGAAQRWFFEV